MASKTPGAAWRDDLLKNALDRFERRFINGTLKDIETVRARLQRKAAKLSGPDAVLRKRVIDADLRRLDGIKRTVQVVLRQGQKNLKAQLGGVSFDQHFGTGGGSTAVSRKR